MSDLDMSAAIPVGTAVRLEARCSCGEYSGEATIVMRDEPCSHSFYSRCGSYPSHKLRVTAHYTLFQPTE